MTDEQPDKQLEGEQTMSEDQVEKPKISLPFLPSEVQLQNVFAIEIVARRFPVETDKQPRRGVGLPRPPRRANP